MATDAKSKISTGYSVGLRNVGSYQVSGHPFITGSLLVIGQEAKVEFPTVTKSITVIASGSANTSIRVHFNPTGSGDVVVGKHYISLDNDEDALTLGVKCREIFISCINGDEATSGFELMASLTGIPLQSMYVLTGSGLTD